MNEDAVRLALKVAEVTRERDEARTRLAAIVSNAETIYRLHEAVDLGKPLIDKDLTVAGKLRAHPGEVLPLRDVPIGRSVAAVFAGVGGLALRRQPQPEVEQHREQESAKQAQRGTLAGRQPLPALPQR